MQSKVNMRWLRAIVTLAIVLVIAFSAGGIWPYLMAGIIGIVSGYAFGFVAGEEFGRDYAFRFLFGDDTREVYRDYFETRLQETVDDRDESLSISELLEKFRDSGVGIPMQSGGGNVKRETALELERMRKNGHN